MPTIPPIDGADGGMENGDSDLGSRISVPCTQIRVGQARIYDGDGPYLARTKVDKAGERKPALVIRGPDSRCE